MCPADYKSRIVWAFMPLCSIQREDSFFKSSALSISVRSDSTLNDIYIPTGWVH